MAAVKFLFYKGEPRIIHVIVFTKEFDWSQHIGKLPSQIDPNAVDLGTVATVGDVQQLKAEYLAKHDKPGVFAYRIERIYVYTDILNEDTGDLGPRLK